MNLDKLVFAGWKVLLIQIETKFLVIMVLYFQTQKNANNSAILTRNGSKF